MEKGQPLAAKCSEFDYAVQNLTQSASVPTIPVMAARFVQCKGLFYANFIQYPFALCYLPIIILSGCCIKIHLNPAISKSFESNKFEIVRFDCIRVLNSVFEDTTHS